MFITLEEALDFLGQIGSEAMELMTQRPTWQIIRMANDTYREIYGEQ